MRVPAGNTADGVHISQASYTNDSTYNDEWVIENVGEMKGIKNGGVYNIVSALSKKCLDVTEAGTANGTLVNQYQVMPAYHWQRWKFIYLGDGQYKIQDVNSGKLLSISGSSSYENANVHIWADDGTTGQIFKIDRNIDGTYSFRSKCSNYGRAVSIAGSSKTSGALAIQCAYNARTPAENQKFTLQDSSKAIIIVPGIMGSELFVGEDNPYFREGMPLFSDEVLEEIALYTAETFIDEINTGFIYPFKDVDAAITSAVDVVYGVYDSMQCNSDGTSKYEIYVKQYKKDFESDMYTNKAGMMDTSLTLFNQLYYSELGDQYVVDLFSYDWRLSNGISAQKLNEYIETSQYENVILIGYSMGGLVTSGYLALGQDQREKVELVYMLASPLLGTPEIANVFYSEDLSFLKGMFSDEKNENFMESVFGVYDTIALISNPVRSLFCNYASIYELFPSEYYFSVANMWYLCFDDHYDDSPSYVYCRTYSQTISVIENNWYDFSSTLMRQAEAFHDSTFANGSHVSSLVNTKYVYAQNENEKTTTYIYYSKTLLNSASLTLIKTEYGDELVPKWSSALGGLYFPSTYHGTGSHGAAINGNFSYFVADNILNGKFGLLEEGYD